MSTKLTDQDRQAHLEELERSGYLVLSLERALAGFDGSEEQLAALRQAGRDFLDAERDAGHAVAREVVAGLEALRASEPGVAVAFLQAAAAGLAAGRKGARAAAGLARLLARQGEDAADAAEKLAAVARLDGRNGTSGLAQLAPLLDQAPPEAVAGVLAPLAGLYERDGELGEAAGAALARAGLVGGAALVGALADLLATEPEGDREYLPDLALAVERGLRKIDPGLAGPYISALGPAARSSAGSAEDLARRLPARADKLAEASRQPYLEQVAAVTERLGPGTIGFCLKKLPALWQSRGAEAVTALVDQSLSLAERHGRWAGQTFLLGQTAAARGARGG